MPGNRWKKRQRDGGIVRGTRETFNVKNGLFITAVGLVNFVNYLIESKPNIEILTHQAPFVILGAFIVLNRKNISRKITAVLFSILGILTTLQGLEDNTGGLVFFIYAFYIFSNRTHIIITLSITSLAILLKSTLLGFSIAESYNIIIFYIWAIIIYFDIIHPKSDTSTSVICPKLDAETLQILQKLYSGINIKQISYDMFITEDAVSKRIQRARIKMNAKSREHLLAVCRELGYISLNIDNSIN